ncbi:hypothetical protein IT412_02525 [Candidatus Peregrinibacteria bacterium]|nr:hypothetical protein [Candidatus Peregrinibacteria bacterium]
MSRGRMDSIGDLGVAARVADLKAEVRYKLVFELIDDLLKNDPFLAMKLRPMIDMIAGKEYMAPEDLYFLLKNKPMAVVLLELEKKIEFFEEKERESLLPAASTVGTTAAEFGTEAPSSVQERKLAPDGHVLSGFSRKISTMLKAVATPVDDSSKEDKGK